MAKIDKIVKDIEELDAKLVPLYDQSKKLRDEISNIVNKRQRKLEEYDEIMNSVFIHGSNGWLRWLFSDTTHERPLLDVRRKTLDAYLNPTNFRCQGSNMNIHLSYYVNCDITDDSLVRDAKFLEDHIQYLNKDEYFGLPENIISIDLFTDNDVEFNCLYVDKTTRLSEVLYSRYNTDKVNITRPILDVLRDIHQCYVSHDNDDR
jgi:hypothetical protein